MEKLGRFKNQKSPNGFNGFLPLKSFQPRSTGLLIRSRRWVISPQTEQVQWMGVVWDTESLQKIPYQSRFKLILSKKGVIAKINRDTEYKFNY